MWHRSSLARLSLIKMPWFEAKYLDIMMDANHYLYQIYYHYHYYHRHCYSSSLSSLLFPSLSLSSLLQLQLLLLVVLKLWLLGLLGLLLEWIYKSDDQNVARCIRIIQWNDVNLSCWKQNSELFKLQTYTNVVQLRNSVKGCVLNHTEIKSTIDIFWKYYGRFSHMLTSWPSCPTFSALNFNPINHAFTDGLVQKDVTPVR